MPKPLPIRFPRDEQAHECSIEWWYWNGQLRDARGNEYAYMECLFKADRKAVQIPMLSKFPVDTIYFRHGLLCDLRRKKSYPVVSNYVLTSADSFTKPLLFVNYAEPSLTTYVNCVMEQHAADRYHVKTEQIDLTLHSERKPLLVGGKGFITVGEKKDTYYYSLPRLRTSGTILIEGKSVAVSGLSWMDHQWADVQYTRDKWTWFCLQLDDGTDILCFAFGPTGGRCHATIGFANGRQETADDVRITAGERSWKSPLTLAEYPLSWRIEIPGRNIDLQIETVLDEQELLFTTINYWEGPIRVTGTNGKKKVRGRGFLELVGYPSKFGNIRYAKSEVRKMTRLLRSFIRK
ncbi:MAG: hypothetical protein HOO67_07815 [Candidatus Peribacteraceae bacterium]|nr:hypothetical protein [Candidatus Peribacteraceae bacterium]